MLDDLALAGLVTLPVLVLAWFLYDIHARRKEMSQEAQLTAAVQALTAEIAKVVTAFQAATANSTPDASVTTAVTDITNAVSQLQTLAP